MSRGPRLIWVTWLPSPEKMLANSQATNPPPRIMSLRGSFPRRMMVSEVCTLGRSMPGTSGSIGRAPAARTSCDASTCVPLSVTKLVGLVRRTASRTTVTFSACSRFFRPEVEAASILPKMRSRTARQSTGSVCCSRLSRDASSGLRATMDVRANILVGMHPTLRQVPPK